MKKIELPEISAPAVFSLALACVYLSVSFLFNRGSNRVRQRGRES